MKWFATVAALAVAATLFVWLPGPDSSQNKPPQEAAIAGSDSPSPLNPKDRAEGDGKLPTAKEAGGTNQIDSTSAILREEEQRIVQFFTAENKPIAIEAECYLIESNDILRERMSTFARLGQSLWGDSIVFESLSQPITGKLVVDSAYQNADFLLAFVEGYAPFVGGWSPPAAGDTIPIRLEAVAPIEVRVIDQNDNPIEGAEIWINYGGTFDHSDGADDIARLRQRFFQFGYTTNKEGQVKLPTCFEGAHNEVLLIPGSKWGSENFLVDSGQSFEYVVKPGFTLKGSVTLDGKVPDRETWVKVLDRTGGHFSQLSSGRVKEEGRYLVEGILATPQVVDVLGSAEGVAIDFIPLFNPRGGDIIELDLQ